MPGNINVFSTVDAPSMRWILRDYHYVRYGTALPISGQYTGETPAILITLPEQETPQLTSAYRGQDFAWWVRPGWTGILPEDLSNWLTFREAPLQVDKIILWARSDLFSGAVPAEPVPSDSPVFDPEEIK